MKIREKLDERPERGTPAWLKPALVSAGILVERSR